MRTAAVTGARENTEDNAMTDTLQRADLAVAATLVRFVEDEALPGLDIAPADFWNGVSRIVAELTPRNRALLETRDELQAEMDLWLAEHGNPNASYSEYKAFLSSIGYLVPEGPDFAITTDNVDTEISAQAGPQLVVPIMNARFSLNATNARWGSLYDALYGTDVIAEDDGAERSGGYNPVRGARVIAYARAFLDRCFPLVSASHAAATAYVVADGQLQIHTDAGIAALADPGQFAGHTGDAAAPSGVLLKNHGLHVEIAIDRASPIGQTDTAGVRDLILEAAITAIQDCEDSVAAVDADDKTVVYRNWLGLMQGTLEDTFEKGGRSVTRRPRDGPNVYGR